MDRKSISSPVFHDNDGANNYINTHHFRLQQEMQDVQSTLREHIDNLAIDIRHSEARKRDYIDTKLDEQWIMYETWWPNTSLLPLRHLHGGDAQVAHLRSGHKMQVPCGTVKKTFMSTREDLEMSTNKTELRLLPPVRHLRLRTYGIFAYFP